MRSIVAYLAIVIGLAGCVSKYKTDTFTGAEVQLSSEGGFYVMLAPHGTYGSKVYMNSGRETTQAVAAALSHHVEICAAIPMPMALNTSVNTAMANSTDRVQPPLPMATNSSVDTGMASRTDSGYRTYIITARWMISGELLK